MSEYTKLPYFEFVNEMIYISSDGGDVGHLSMSSIELKNLSKAVLKLANITKLKEIAKSKGANRRERSS